MNYYIIIVILILLFFSYTNYSKIKSILEGFWVAKNEFLQSSGLSSMTLTLAKEWFSYKGYLQIQSGKSKVENFISLSFWGYLRSFKSLFGGTSFDAPISIEGHDFTDEQLYLLLNIEDNTLTIYSDSQIYAEFMKYS